MRGGFDRLVKEIDALTYNARSTINALIRSTMRAGTTSGYKVTRAGIDIELTHEDIYILYKFYEKWEEDSFSEDDFEDIADDLNATDALIKHSKILFLTSDNSGEVDTNSYWIGLLKDSNNPKLISNLAPIPINIRTPIFDENLSTQKYNEEETYLFPFSYFSGDILGYSGDGINHNIDGLSWTISADNYVSIETDAFSTGGVNSSDTRKTKKTRNHKVDSDGNAVYVTFSDAMGYATQARGKYSFAAGLSSIVPSTAESGIAIGNKVLASDYYAVAIGGSGNKAVGEGSGTIAGFGSTAAGLYSIILGGQNNFTGSDADNFVFPSSDSNTSECISVDNTCETSTTTGTVVGKNTISISGNVSSKYYIGDTVSIHTHTLYSDTSSHLNYWDVNGNAYGTQKTTIVAIQYIDSDTYPNSVNQGNTLITLYDDVSGNYIDGGYISRIKNKDGDNLGFASAVLNYNNIALGSYQTVIGKYNYPLEDARFIIGNGSGTSDETRSNIVEVSNNSFNIFGTNHNFNYIPSEDDTSIYYSFNYVGLETKVKESSFNLYEDNFNLALDYQNNSHYIGLYGNTTDDYDYNILLTALDKPLLIRSGDYNGYRNTFDNADIMIRSEGNLFLESDTDFVSIDSNYISLSADLDLSINWEGTLSLYGDTFGALPTTDEQYSHYVPVSNRNSYTINNSNCINCIARSGFYDIENTSSNANLTGGYSSIDNMDFCEMLVIGDYNNVVQNPYFSWKLLFPVILNSTDDIPNIGVMFNELDSNGNETSTSLNRPIKYLAYTDSNENNLSTINTEASINLLISNIKYWYLSWKDLSDVTYFTLCPRLHAININGLLIVQLYIENLNQITSDTGKIRIFLNSSSTFFINNMNFNYNIPVYNTQLIRNSDGDSGNITATFYYNGTDPIIEIDSDIKFKNIGSDDLDTTHNSVVFTLIGAAKE